MIKKALSDTHHEIAGEAENGEQAIIKYEELLPDIVTMDVDMPGISGLEAARKITAKYPDAYIIIISSHEKNDLKEIISDYGVKYFIIKPVTREKLMEVIDSILLESKYTENKNKAVRKESERIDSGGINIDSGKNSVLKTGNMLATSHFSQLQLFSTIIEGTNKDIMTLKLTKEFAVYGIFSGDPLVILCEVNNEQYILQCTVGQVNSKNNTVDVSIFSVNFLNDDRLLDNYPTSLQIDIKDIETKTRIPSLIVSMSDHDLSVKSKNEFIEGNIVNFDLPLAGKVVSFDAKITSKRQGPGSFEYTFRIAGDYSRKQALKLYLRTQREEHRKALINIKYGKI